MLVVVEVEALILVHCDSSAGRWGVDCGVSQQSHFESFCIFFVTSKPGGVVVWLAAVQKLRLLVLGHCA